MVRFPRVSAAMNSVKFNEDSRVKVPVVLQLLRLGYSFLSRDEWEKQREPRTNILRDVFAEAYVKLNEGKTEADARHYIDTVLVPVLDNDDLGRQFYRKLEAQNTGEVKIGYAIPTPGGLGGRRLHSRRTSTGCPPNLPNWMQKSELRCPCCNSILPKINV